MDYKLNAVSEFVQNIRVRSESLLFHPTLNVIIVSTNDASVLVINPETGLVLHKSDLSAKNANALQWKYVPGSDKLVVTDGHRFGCRSNHDGIILLDTILQKTVNNHKNIVKLEMLNTEAIAFLNAIQTCNLSGFDDLKQMLTEGIDLPKTANSVKEQKWATVCLKLPLATIMKSALTLLVTLLPRKPANPALPLLSSVLEQMSEMCEGYDPVKLTKASRMGVEARRRTTFDNWPHKNFKWAFPEQMAKAGFYHEPDKTGDDRAFCFTCSICLISWELMDEPWTEHERHSPSCPFILGDFTTNVPLSVTNSTAVAFDTETNPLTKGSLISKIGSSSVPDLVPVINQSKNEIIIFDISSGIQFFYSFCTDNIFNFESTNNCQKFIISNVCLLQKLESEEKEKDKENDNDKDKEKESTLTGILISVENSKSVFMFNIRKKTNSNLLGRLSQQLLKPTQQIELLNKSKLNFEFDVMDFLPLADSQEVLIVLKSSDVSDQYGGVLNLYPVHNRGENMELKDQPNRRYLLPCETPLNTVLIPNAFLDDGSPHNSFYATVCIDGSVRVYDLDSFATLLELSLPATKIVSATFCQSIERLCCATNDGFLHFFKLVASSDCSDLLIDPMEKEREQFIKDLRNINAKTKFDLSKLRKLYTLCEYEPLRSLDLERRAFSAIAPNNWTEVIQPTLQHKQYPILEIMSSIMWKYVADGTPFIRNHTHIFELNLLQATYLSHIDLRLNLNHNIFNFNVEASLLSITKQNTSMATDEEVLKYNVECGPIVINNYIDDITHTADLTLTCPNLITSRSRTLFIEIKLFPCDENPEEDFNIAKTFWPLTSFSSCNVEDDETPIKEKYSHTVAKSFPIDCVSISFQSQKHGTMSDSDQTIRSFMLESNNFFEALVYNILNNNDNIVTDRRSLIAFDVLLWVATKKLTRRCSGTVPIDQQECFETVIAYIPFLLKHCLFFGDRSLAHKCVKFFHMMYLCTKHLDVNSFSSITYKTLSDMLDEIDRIESCGSLHWFTVLLMNFIPKDYAEEVSERCLDLLKKVAVLLNVKKTPYDTFLRSKFDLFGNPFEPKMFDMKPPIFNIRISETQPPTYANALKESEVSDVKVVCEYEDSLTLSKDMLFMKNADKVYLLMKDWFPVKFCYGLMEVTPLHFTCSSSSDSTFVLPLSEHRDTTKLMRAAKAAHFQQDKCGSIASMFNSYSNEIFEHLAQFLIKTDSTNTCMESSNSKSRKFDGIDLHHDMAFSCMGNDLINTGNEHKLTSLSKFFTVPPQQVLCMDRLHSGSRRYITLDFGSPVLLTDILIPPCADFASLMIDVCLHADFLSSSRIAVSTDISTRFLIIGDLQPAPICRYVKITVIGRFGATTIRCRTLIGNFYGHALIDDELEPKAQFDVAQSNQLASIFEEVNCKYRLACSKLKSLLQPLLKNGSSMDIDEDLSNATNTNSKTKCQNYAKIITYYDEAMQYKYQLNILKNIFSKYKMTDLDHANLYDELNIEADVSLDKLVNLSELIFGLLWYYGDSGSIEIDMATCEQLFNAYCLSEHLQTQLLVVNFLINFCSRKKYWGKFIAELLLKIFSSNNRNKNYSDDRVFILLCYMGSRSPDRSGFFDAVFKQLSTLILPLATTNTTFSPMNTKIDLVQLEWFLLFISVQFDFIYSSNNWKWLSNNTSKKCETKNLTSLESITGNNSDNLYTIAGTSQSFMINYKPKKKSKVQNPFIPLPQNANICDGTNAYLLSLSQKASNDMKKTLSDFKKDPKSVSNHDFLSMFHNKNLLQPSSDLARLLNYYQSNRHNGTIEDIQLDKTSAFIALRALMTLLVNIDISCHADLIPIACKVIAQIAHCSQTEINRFVTKRELKILLEIFLRSSNANNSWIRYSIMILIFDLLETTFTDSLPFLNEYQNTGTNRKNNFTQIQLLPGTNNRTVQPPPLLSYYSLINISKTIDDRISMGLEISAEYYLRKLSADKAGTLFSSFDKIKILSNSNENNSEKIGDRKSWWSQDMLDKWQIDCCNTRANIVPEIIDELIQGLSDKSTNYFDYLLHIWQLIAYNFQITKLQNSSYEAIIQYCVKNSLNINIKTWNHVFIIFNSMKMNEKWFLVENPSFFTMLQKLLSKHDLDMQQNVSVRLQESFNLCLMAIKNQIESNHMNLQQQTMLQNNCLNLLNVLIEPNSGPFCKHIGPINLQIEFFNFMIMYFDSTIDKYWTINKESIFQIIYNTSQLLLNQMNRKSPVYCLSLGTVPEDNLKTNTFIDMNTPDSIPSSIKGLLFLLMFIINNILVRLIDLRDESVSNSSPSPISLFLSQLLDNELIACNFLTILSQSNTTNLFHLMNINNETFSPANLRKHMHTIEDGVYRFIVIILMYNLEPMKILNPIMKILQSTEKISEVFVFLLQNVFRNEELITLFLNKGGSEILSRGIIKSVQNMTKDHRGCVSSMIQQLAEPTEFLESSTDTSRQKIMQEVFDMKRGLMNFAPLSTISCPMASGSQQPDILINSTAPSNRRARCAQWDYLFPFGRTYVEVFITLPYAVQVNEVQIQPFLSNLASCPSEVAIEISKYVSGEYVPITQPLKTVGMKFIRLFLPTPEVVMKLVLRFYKPLDSDHLTLSYIRILGTTVFQNLSAKQTVDTDNFGWLRAFHNLVNILRSKSDNFRLPETFDIDKVLGAYCHLLLSPINVLAFDLIRIENTLLTICLHDEINGLKLLNMILSGHKMDLSDEIGNDSQDNSFLIPVMFNSMSKYSVCKILYDMADYYRNKNKMFLNRVKILLKWLENLTLYVTSSENLMVDNYATYIYCISEILWPPNDEAVDNELRAAISSNIMPKLAEWSMKLTNWNKTIKQAVNSVLCSICAIDSDNFITILKYLNFIESVSEQQSSSTSTQSYLSIDQKLCLTESQLEMLTMLIQSPKCINIFIDSGLSTALINAVSGFCMKSSTLPMSNTTMVTAILKLFSNLCYWKKIQNWLGTKGAIFWKLLLERLCCRSTRNVHVNLDTESYTQLEDEYIHFISKCCLLNSKNQQLLAQTLCDAIAIHNKSSSSINNSPTKSNKHYLTAFTRRIITQILLESEKITLFVYSNEMVTKNDVYSNVNVNCHPEFMKTLYTECLQLSVNCTLKDLLNFHISFDMYSKKTSNSSETGSDNVPFTSNKKRPIISTNLWDLTSALKSNAFHKKLKNSECFTLQNYNSLFNAEGGEADIEQQSDIVKFESSDDCDLDGDDDDDDEEDDFDDDDIQVIWCANSQKKSDDLSTSQFSASSDELKAKQSMLQVQNSLNSHHDEFIVKCLDLPNIDRLPLNLTLGQIYKMIELSTVEPQHLCIRLYVTRSDSKKDCEKMETDTNNVNEIPIITTPPTTALQAFSSIGGLAILSQYLTVSSDNLSEKLSSDVFMKPIKYCRSNLYQINKDNKDNVKESNLSGLNETMDFDSLKYLQMQKNVINSLNQISSEVANSYNALRATSTTNIIDLKALNNDIPIRNSSVSFLEIPNYSLIMFSLCLRLPLYANMLLTDMKKACYLLRILLGVTDNEDGDEIVDLKIAASLPLLPFEILRRLLDNTPLDSNSSRTLRNTCVSLGITDLIIYCIIHFLNQKSYNSNDKKFISSFANGNNAEKNNGNDNGDKNNYWAKGTGFGTGSTQQTWNVEMSLIKQKNEEKQISALLNLLSSYINPGDNYPASNDLFIFNEYIPDGFVNALCESSIVTTLSSYLRNDSVLDMSRHILLYMSVIKLLRAVSMNSQLVKLLTDNYAENGQYLILFLLEKMNSCLKNYESKLLFNRQDSSVKKSKLSFSSSDKQISCDENVSSLIPNLSETIRIMTCAINCFQGKPISMETTSIADSSSLKNVYISSDLTPQELYVKIMEKLQFNSYEMIVGSHDSENNYMFTVSYHYESLVRLAGNQTRPSRVKRLAQEAVTLSNSLPLSYNSTVFVRTDIDRLDIMKVLITGPDDTPYSNGCFEFDVYFPLDYPKVPMSINLETTGYHTVRFNPNLYNDGKVCLSILNTWHGRPEEKWNSKASSFLQVLVSIQSLILVSEPYFNEPGYERSRGTHHGDQSSKDYNVNIYQATVRWGMLEHLVNPNPCFKEIIETHFYLKRNEIFKQLDDWCEELETFYNEKEKEPAESSTNSQNGNRLNIKNVTINQVVQFKKTCQEVKDAIKKLKNPLIALGVNIAKAPVYDEMIDLSSIDEQEILKEFPEDQVEAGANQAQVQDPNQTFNISLSNENDDKMDVEIDLEHD